MARFLYSLFLHLLLPYVGLRLWRRARRQPEYGEHLAERFGAYDTAPGVPLIWLHAVSVGETRAAQPLVTALAAQYPRHHILLTHMTPTGRQTSVDLFGERVSRAYLPYDYPFAVARFLEHFRPEVGLIMETEIWPNLVTACARRGVPLLLVNARMSAKSARRYAGFPALVRDTLQRLTAIAAQTEVDAVRLRALGAPEVAVTGNVKFDILPAPEQIEQGYALRARIGTRPVLLVASSREGEEALVLDALARHPLGDALLVIVPRHPQRFDEVAGLIAAHGLELQRRTAGTAIAAQTRVLLGDTMGELYAYYSACDIAFVGGSLLPLGGQNLIEACAVGAPVLIGPHTFNFAQATEQAIAAGAARRVADGDDLLQTAHTLLTDARARKAMSDAGLSFAARHRGATGRTMQIVAHAMGNT
jgi:3-deoxy-D-manno-octulosonic-acid transferase